MVDETGNLTAIIDWESESAVPSWRACQIPQLLEGRTRDVMPMREQYAPESDGDEQGRGALDDEIIDSIHGDHLLEYEQTELRKLFKQEMAKLNATWVTILESSTLEAGFEKAVHNCDSIWDFKIVRRWLDAYKQGKAESLAEMMLR